MRSGVAPCPTEICGALVCFRVRRYALSRRAKGMQGAKTQKCMHELLTRSHDVQTCVQGRCGNWHHVTANP